MGNQRALDQFNFVVDNGGAEPAPSTPSNLQSPAAIIPDSVGNVSLAMVSNAGSNTSTLNITGANAPGAVSGINITGGVASIAVTSNTEASVSINGTQSLLTIGQAESVPLGLLNSGTGVLRIQAGVNESLPNTASFDVVDNIVNLGNPLTTGQIYLNNPTNITNSGTRPSVGGLLLQQLTASSSSIGQQVATDGVLVLGSSAAHPTTMIVSDIPYLGASNFVEIYGGAGLAPLFLSGAQGAAQQCGIHPDIGTGGQLLLGSSNTSNSQIQITDATVQYNVTPTVNTSLIFTSPRIPPSGVMASNTDYLITNPPNIGLYAIVVNVDNSAAGTNNAQLSTIGYWNGSIWDYGGCGRSSIFGGGDFFLSFGIFPPYAVRAALSATFTGASANPAVYVKFIPLFGNMGL